MIEMKTAPSWPPAEHALPATQARTWRSPEFRALRFEIWAVADFAKCASKFGLIWRTVVAHEIFVFRSQRRTDGYTHLPPSGLSRAACDRLLVRTTYYRMSGTHCHVTSARWPPMTRPDARVTLTAGRLPYAAGVRLRALACGCAEKALIVHLLEGPSMPPRRSTRFI